MQYLHSLHISESDLHTDTSRSQQIRVVRPNMLGSCLLYTPSQAYAVLIELLRHGQSNAVTVHILNSVQGFIHRFPALLYRGNSEYCAPLCIQVPHTNVA